MPDQDPRQAAASTHAREVRPAPETPRFARRPRPVPPGAAGGGACSGWSFSSRPRSSSGSGSWGRQSSAPTAAATRAQTAAASIQVGVASVTTGDIPVTLDELGTVTPLATVTVKSQVSGHITDIKFQEGQIVQKGDLLMVIDVRPFTIALESAQATLAHDQALLANARVDLARFQKLMEQDSIAKQTLDTQGFLVTQDVATVQLDQAAVDNAKLNLDYCHITAPITGRIGLRQVDLGNYVTAGSDALVVIARIQPITVVFALPEDNGLPAVMKQIQGGAVLPATAYDRSMTTKIAAGQLLTLDNQIDTTTGTIKLKAQFDNTDESLFPNQFVNIRLLVSTLTGVPVVPRAAVLNGAPGDYVYLRPGRRYRGHPPGQARTRGWRAGLDPIRPRRWRSGGGRRHRPPARRRQDQHRGEDQAGHAAPIPKSKKAAANHEPGRSDPCCSVFPSPCDPSSADGNRPKSGPIFPSPQGERGPLADALLQWRAGA